MRNAKTPVPIKPEHSERSDGHHSGVEEDMFESQQDFKMVAEPVACKIHFLDRIQAEAAVQPEVADVQLLPIQRWRILVQASPE